MYIKLYISLNMLLLHRVALSPLGRHGLQGEKRRERLVREGYNMTCYVQEEMNKARKAMDFKCLTVMGDPIKTVSNCLFDNEIVNYLIFLYGDPFKSQEESNWIWPLVNIEVTNSSPTLHPSPLTYVSHIHVTWFWNTASHLIGGIDCDDIDCPYRGVLLTKVTGIGTTSLVVWTLMGDWFSARSKMY